MPDLRVPEARRCGRARRAVRTVAWVAAGLLVTLVADSVRAATVTDEYRPGTRREVLINGYALRRGAGAFTIDDGGRRRTCFCIEAHTDHSSVPDAYRRASRSVTDPALDALLFLQGRGLPTSARRDDLAVATQLLGYHLARARRRGGGLVWYDTAARRTVTPTSPVPWNALPRLSLTFPVGIRVGGVDRDDLEALVHQLDGLARTAAGPWTLGPIRYDAGAGRATARVTGAAGPITMPGVARWRVEGPGGEAVRRATAPVVDGTVALDGIALPEGGVIVLEVDAPGRHLEYSGPGIQRLACGEVAALRRRHTVERTRPTTTTSTAPTSTTPAPTTTAPTTTTAPPTTSAPTPTEPTTTPAPTTAAPTTTTAPTTSTTLAPTTTIAAPTIPATLAPTTTIAAPTIPATTVAVSTTIAGATSVPRTTDAPTSSSTTSTVPPSRPTTSTSPVPSTGAPDRSPELPRSGRAQGWQVVLAAVLVGAGAALVALSRSGRSAGPSGPDPG